MWDGLEAKHGAPWLQHSESELRQFLLDRIADGYLFPINPIWPVRDQGWYEVFSAMRNAPGADKVLPIWYPEDLIEQIDRLHEAYPDGITHATNPSPGSEVTSDLSGDEALNFGIHEVDRAAKARWHKLKFCVRLSTSLVCSPTLARCISSP